MDHRTAFPPTSDQESFRPPQGTALTYQAGAASTVSATSLVSLASHRFEFRENSNTPGRFLEQSVVVSVPVGAGYFCCTSQVMGAFTTPNFQFLTERPFGQFHVSVGLRGNNLVCTVRLTDSNSDDPIFIVVDAIVVFFR